MAQAGRIYDSFQEYAQEPFQTEDRFYVRSTVYLPNSEVDPRTGMLRADARRHGRTQALRMTGDKLDEDFVQLNATLQAHVKEKGIQLSRSTAFAIVLIPLLICSLILLVQQGSLVHAEQRLQTVNQRIESVKTSNADLKQQIAEASDSATICYAAARDLGMVPASSTQAIHLTAMDTRPSDPASTYANNTSNGQYSADTAGASGK
jgi:cell division protein FtsL